MQQDDKDVQALLATDLDRHYAQLVLRYERQLYAFIVRQTGSTEDAEDIVQDALIQAYFALARYSREQIQSLALRPWLYKITLNVFYGRLRKSRLQCVSLDTTEEGPHVLIEDQATDQPDLVVEGREAYRELGAQVNRLPEHYRDVVNLYYFVGLSYQEIANLLNMPLGSVKSHLHRGISRLRQTLATQRREGR